MLFVPAPTTINSSVCSGIEAFNKRRPEPSNAYNAVTWTMFSVSCFLWLVAIAFFIWSRTEPRMRIVRPLFVSIILAVSHFFFAVGALLNLVVPSIMPCGVMAGCIIVGLAGMGVNYFIRILVFMVESQFEAKAESSKMHLRDDSDSIVLNKIPSVKPTTTSSKFSVALALIRVGFGIIDLDDLPVEDLAVARQMFGLTTVCVLVVPFITLLVIFIRVPQYRSRCTGCSLFWEVVIGFGGGVTLYVLIASRLLYISYSKKFPDHQGLLQECFWIDVFVCGPCVILSVLLVLDPGAMHFRRLIAYEWFFSACMLLHWWVAVGRQMLYVFKYRAKLQRAEVEAEKNVSMAAEAALLTTPNNGQRKRRSSYEGRHAPGLARSSTMSTTSSSSLTFHQVPGTANPLLEVNALLPFSPAAAMTTILDFLDEMDSNDAVKEQFTRFAISRYAVENLHFVNDVRAFKRFFFDKARNWKRQKALFLCMTYIQLHAAMEVNISDSIRKTTIHDVETNLLTNDLVNAFDRAVMDIASNVLREIWIEFLDDKSGLGRTAVVDAEDPINDAARNAGGSTSSVQLA